jgi:hypothetical protein
VRHHKETTAQGAFSRERGVTPGELAEWRDEALVAMQAGL